jgi:hypothetical protein
MEHGHPMRHLGEWGTTDEIFGFARIFNVCHVQPYCHLQCLYCFNWNSHFRWTSWYGLSSGRSWHGQSTHRQGLSRKINSFLSIYFIKMKIISTSHISKILLLILRLLPVTLLYYSKLEFFLSKIEWIMCELEIYLHLNRSWRITWNLKSNRKCDEKSAGAKNPTSEVWRKIRGANNPTRRLLRKIRVTKNPGVRIIRVTNSPWIRLRPLPCKTLSGGGGQICQS